MAWSWFVEEVLSSGEKVTIPFDTKEEMKAYIKSQK